MIRGFIPVNEPVLDGNEKKYLIDCIDTGWISSEGPYVKRFEKEFVKLAGKKHGIAVSSGSGALEIAIKALGIGPEDQVIMPTFTIISCAAAIVRAGATPVLIDSDPETWNMDVSKVERKITKRTKAIMVVHVYGLPVDMYPLIRIAKKYGLKLIEDAAEMHGQTYNGKPCGSFGDVSVFSFYSNKHITTGEGGMICTNNKKIAEQCRSLRNLAFHPQKRFLHYHLGWNYRLTNLQAAIGLAQLEKIDERINQKRQLGKLYNLYLSNIEEIQIPLARTEYAENIYWVYGVVVKDKIKCGSRSAINYLSVKKIGARPFFIPMHKQPVFKKMKLFKKEKYPIAERLSKKGFYIPLSIGLTESKIKKISLTIKDLIETAKNGNI